MSSMTFRFMRILVFFDLPVETAQDRLNYSRFHKFLIREGFVMMQESVYVKLALNGSIVDAVKRHLSANAPQNGTIQMLVVTEKQFADISYIAGNKNTDVVDSTDRYIVL